ncbi:hypothetical protein IGI04_042793 [Brassica rapa subsp. trilocularis]|uniref:Uncharacterized protein n=1 Tax=Brassica rapa subsp. trilocularis TaxID=1813537 RepID=A0ABQ7KKY0_BRACM|nr:hypothetical protein IGI04_042793 [Brassica rapa subsp. trilocularis]
MKPVSILHPSSRLFMPLRVESSLPPSLLTICVCSQDTEEALDMIIHDQSPSKGRASLPSLFPMKLLSTPISLLGCIGPWEWIPANSLLSSPFACVHRLQIRLWVLSTMIKTVQRVVLNFPLDLPQNCLFMAFTPPWVLDWESDQLSVFFYGFFVFQGVEGSPGVPAKARTCLPNIGEGVVTS